ncbi:hypothetical protein HAX54_036602 [Datura stramonium]|uniref:Uncharacterized protein n=1 Tax=Datura stramonium TaxID=4076 RepID=A0ABS8VH28_DATST|nr:hypothetical protein [Datura stramonium]
MLRHPLLFSNMLNWLPLLYGMEPQAPYTLSRWFLTLLKVTMSSPSLGRGSVCNLRSYFYPREVQNGSGKADWFVGSIGYRNFVLEESLQEASAAPIEKLGLVNDLYKENEALKAQVGELT